MERYVYADNAATTPVSESVRRAMLPYFEEGWGNPSSLHRKGREAKAAIDNARSRVAAAIGAEAREIFFTSCGSEADNWAIKGAAFAARRKNPEKNHIITTVIEHPAVLETCRGLEKDGFSVTYLPVDGDGIVSVEDLTAAITPSTILAEVMFANNEIGTIEPIKELAAAAHEKGILFFTDAVQAVGAVDINVKELGVDMLSMSGHKMHAPKGIGALYIRRGVVIDRLISGGGQERGQRAGTENVAFAAALAQAIDDATASLSDMERVAAMRDRLIEGLLKIPHTRLNGSRDKRLPGNVNVAFEFIEGESLLLLLDMAGIAGSTGSACSSASLEPSHVLLSIGLPAEKAHGSLRLTVSHDNTDEDIDYILEQVPKAVARLREMSPLTEF